MTKKLAVTLHSVALGKDERLVPGVTTEFEDGLYADLMKAGAIREPNEAEAEIWASLQKPASEPAKADDKPVKAAKPAKAAKSDDKPAVETAGDDDEMLG